MLLMFRLLHVDGEILICGYLRSMSSHENVVAQKLGVFVLCGTTIILNVRTVLFPPLAVPAPTKLTLERQLKNSIIISWVHPDTIARQEIEEYRVYVNGQFRTSTKRDAKTRALVENIKPAETYRISVRTVTIKGHSDDASCSIMIGPGRFKCLCMICNLNR